MAGILLSGHAGPSAAIAGWSVLSIFVLSHILLSSAASHLLESTHLNILLLLGDTFLFTFALTLSDFATPRLYLFFFLMVLVISLVDSFVKILLGSSVVMLLCFFGSLGWQPAWDSLGGIPHPILIPFFVMASLYYGFFTAEIRRKEALTDKTHREGEESKTVLGILKTTTSTLDFQKVMWLIAKNMGNLLQATRVSIVMVDADRIEGYVLASSDEPNISRLKIKLSKYPEIQEALKTASPVIINDIEKSSLLTGVLENLRRLEFRSLLVIPLQYGDEIFGTICLRASRQLKEFTSDEVRFAEIVASAAANAVKNSLLYRQVLEETRHHKNNAQQLLEKTQQFRSLFDHLPDFIFLVDQEGRITDFNRSASHLTGFSFQEVRGQHLTKIWPSVESFPRLVEKFSNGRPLEMGTVQIKRKDESPLEVQLTLLLDKDQGQPIRGIIGIAQDLSKDKNTQIQMEHAERLSSLGELVATVSHELRNRLTGVLGFSQLVSMKNKNPQLARNLEHISTSAEQCKTILNDLLSFSRKSVPNRKVLGVNGILRKTLDLMESQLESNHIQVIQEFDQHLPLSFLDFHQIQQVFLNILTNAQQAISSTEKEGEIRIRTRQEGNEAIVEFQDTGPGMNQKVLAKIFDPFFTTKVSGVGTGLGLSYSYGIVRNHDGRIEVESEPGHGTLFRIRLPITQTTQESLQVERTSSQSSGKKILVIDDDPKIVDLYLEILLEMDLRADTAANGLEAFQKIQKNDYDLVITDLKMPKMNGIELVKRIQEIKPEIISKIVLTTGSLTYMNSQDFMRFSDLPCLIKPLDIPEVQQVVAKVLAK